MFPVALPLFATLLGLGGCLPAGPLFEGIRKVEGRQVTTDGTKRIDFGDGGLHQKVISCMYQSAQIEEGQTADNLLPEVYLFDVTDASGTRTFEMFTRENLKGNKGKYYRNRCMWPLLEQYDEQRKLEEMSGRTRRNFR